MKIYASGDKQNPPILLFPGTFCHWKSNFGKVIPLLKDHFYVLTVSYDGFDETDHTEFSTVLEEVEKIEAFVRKNYGGRIRGAYGCSMGGSLVGLLAAREKIHMDYGILGSSDLDQGSMAAAKLQMGMFMPIVYPLIRDGDFSAKLLQKMLQENRKKYPEYVDALLEMFGCARPYVTQTSCKNQFSSDLTTPLPMGISPKNTEIHVFYALKMGEKYRERYLTHFSHPILHEQDLLHEELLACYPEAWAALVTQIFLGQYPSASNGKG